MCSWKTVLVHFATEEDGRIADVGDSRLGIGPVFDGDPAPETDRAEDGENLVVIVQSLADHAVLKNTRVAQGGMEFLLLEVLGRAALEVAVAGMHRHHA